MKSLKTLIACAIFAAPVAAADKDFDAAKLEGKWKVTEGWKFGVKSSAEAIAGEVTITKDTFTIKGNDMTHVMAFKIDAKASPVAITMTGKEGPSKDFVSEGIIEITGDEIELCYAMPMEKRPTKFESPKDSKILYFTMKKAK